MPFRGRIWGVLLVALAAVGCIVPKREVPLPPGVQPNDIVDPDDPTDLVYPLTDSELVRLADILKTARKPDRVPRSATVLVLSGGGVYGAYSAGVLCGWTKTGQRPNFDVVTGVSAGALTAPFAFVGPEYDHVLEDAAVRMGNDDVFRIRRKVRALLAESVADNSPLRERLDRLITPEFLAKVAAEHALGRRLYVGSTNLDTKRLVVWDMGAIASRATPESRQLFLDVLAASAAIPGFFPSVRFQVEIDGRQYEELHVDGGVTRSLFFRPPVVAPEDLGIDNPLWNTTVYVLYAGKLYPDPAAVRPRTLSVTAAAVANLVYTSARGDLSRLFTLCMLTGMRFRLAAIPPGVPVPSSNTKFDPVAMGLMFSEGMKRAENGTAFESLPPVLEPSEELRARTGLRLRSQPTR